MKPSKLKFLLLHIVPYPVVVFNDMAFFAAYFFLKPEAFFSASVVFQLLSGLIFYLLIPAIYASVFWKKIDMFDSGLIDDRDSAERSLRRIPLVSTLAIGITGMVYVVFEIVMIMLSGSEDMIGAGLLHQVSMIFSMFFSYSLIPAGITYYLMSQFAIRYREHVFRKRNIVLSPGRGHLSTKLFVMLLAIAVAPLILVVSDLAGTGFFGEFNSNNFTVIMDVIYVLIGVFLAVTMMSESFVRPLSLLSGFFEKVKEGDYSVRAPVLTDDEVGRLSLRFNQMTAGLEERELIKKTFGQYMGSAVAEEILSGSIDLSGQEKTVTVLFTDIQNYTGISEMLEPRRVVTLLNRYFSEVVRIIDDHKGVVNKYIGDAVMAIFNAPVDDPRHAENALKAAVRISEYSKNTVYEGDIRLITRIGINTGPVIVGNIGAAERLEYTAIGDTVNLAQRLEALNKKSGTSVLFSDATKKLLPAGVYRKIGNIRVKGRRNPVRVYSPS